MELKVQRSVQLTVLAFFGNLTSIKSCMSNGIKELSSYMSLYNSVILLMLVSSKAMNFFVVI